MTEAYLAHLNRLLAKANDPELTNMVSALITQVRTYEDAERERLPQPAGRTMTGYLPWMKAVRARG